MSKLDNGLIGSISTGSVTDATPWADREKLAYENAPRLVQAEADIELLKQRVEHSEKACDEFDDGLRTIAFLLGAGGYNAENLTATQLLDKVRWGVDHLREISEARIKVLHGERAQLSLDLGRTGYAFLLACGDITAIGEALGIPGEDQQGGAGELIEAIAQLKTESEALRCDAVQAGERLAKVAGQLSRLRARRNDWTTIPADSDVLTSSDGSTTPIAINAADINWAVTVPRSPTDEMFKAFEAAYAREKSFHDAWKAACSASPDISMGAVWIKETI